MCVEIAHVLQYIYIYIKEWFGTLTCINFRGTNIANFYIFMDK
jgi:hypothetical protein